MPASVISQARGVCRDDQYYLPHGSQHVPLCLNDRTECPTEADGCHDGVGEIKTRVSTDFRVQLTMSQYELSPGACGCSIC